MRTLVGAVVLVGMLALSGCVDGDRIPTLPPAPTATPLFASEEEALAAAEEAYAAYLGASLLIGSDGGAEAGRIAPFVTEERLEVELEAFARLRESGLRVVGEASFQTKEIQTFDQSDEFAEITFYVCWDGSASRVIDATGADVTPVDRAERLVLEVVMVTAADSADFLLSSDEQWPGSDC